MKIKVLLLIGSLVSFNALADTYPIYSPFKIDFKSNCDDNLSFNSAIKKNIEALKYDAITYDEFLELNSIRVYVILNKYNNFHSWCYISN